MPVSTLTAIAADQAFTLTHAVLAQPAHLRLGRGAAEVAALARPGALALVHFIRREQY